MAQGIPLAQTGESLAEEQEETANKAKDKTKMAGDEQKKAEDERKGKEEAVKKGAPGAPHHKCFVGLGALLERSRANAPPEYIAPKAGSQAEPLWPPRSLVEHCRNCGRTEEARCTMKLRGKRQALFWKVGLHKPGGAEPGAEEDDRAGGEQPAWGFGLMWVPSELRELQRAADSCSQTDATLEDMGETWGPHGSHWAWAHDGVRPNGWIRLLEAGKLDSKWGAGSWQLFEAVQPPLLLVTFNGTEHGLRLADGGFDVVSKRRPATDGSLADNMQEPISPDAPTCSGTRGWPCLCPLPRRG